MGQTAVVRTKCKRPAIDILAHQPPHIDPSVHVQIDPVQAGILTPRVEIGGINNE